MDNLLANRLKKLRKEQKLSQKELASGICEQSQISRIERGGYMPRADLIFQLAQRLGVSVDYFFKEELGPELESQLTSIKGLVKELLASRNYQALSYVYEVEAGKRNQLLTDDRLYLDWLEGGLLYHYYGQTDLAIKKLEKLLKKVPQQQVLFLNVLNILGIIYTDLGQEEKLLDLYQKIDVSEDFDPYAYSYDYVATYIKLLFNYCRNLKRTDHPDAPQVYWQSMTLLKKMELPHQLAFFYGLGVNVVSMPDALAYCKLAMSLFDQIGLEERRKDLEPALARLVKMDDQG